MPDASSQNQPSPKSSEEAQGDRLGRFALRVVIAHSLLLSSAPIIQSMTAIDGAWIGATPLLVMFILGPVIGIWLYRNGQQRLGSIMLLAFMPAAAYTHGRMLLPLLEDGSGVPGVLPGMLGFESVIVLLIISSVLGSLVSFALLRNLHADGASHERKPAV